MRLLVDGGPSIPGSTMAEKLAWVRKHADPLRRSLMLEPRGHAGMHGAMLTEPVSESAHAGILFMHAAGYPMFSGEAVVAAATLALENKLIHSETDELVFDTPAGVVRARPRHESGRIASVELTGAPSFVFAPGLPIQLGARAVRVDIAFGGEFYAITDSESIGIPIDASHAAQLVRAAEELKDAVEAAITVTHPGGALEKRRVQGIQGTIFTAPARHAADLRSATVLEGGVLRRSPGMAGTCALLAVLDAMGLIAGDQPFTHEGLVETTLQARVLSRPVDGEIPFIVPCIDAAAWTTGRHDFEVADGLQDFKI